MIKVILLSPADGLLLLTAVIILLIHFTKVGYEKKRIVVTALLFLPILYFSINMVTEAVTVDEPQYEECITNIRYLKDYPAATKMLYEYKFAQLTIGSVFQLIPQTLLNRMGDNHAWKLYKALHWILMYVISLMISNVWRRDILLSENNTRNDITADIILAALIGLPLSCLLMKAANYDAGSTYPAILGLSLVWAAYNRNDKKKALVATVITALGVLDKWTALPYWMICVALYVLLVMIQADGKEVLKHALKAVVIAYCSAISVSGLYFLYAYFQQHGFVKTPDTGVIVFSYVHAIKAMITGDTSVNSANSDIAYIPIAMLLIFIFAIVLYGLYFFFKNKKISIANVMLKMDAVILAFIVTGGGIAAYLIPLKIAPYTGIEGGYYASCDSFDGWTYHYGAKTAVTHFLMKLAYMSARIVVNLPTVFLILIIASFIFLIVNKHEDEMLFCALLLSSALCLFIAYAIAGLPASARYFSYIIYFIVLCCTYVFYRYSDSLSKRNIIFCTSIVMYLLEMFFYIPNISLYTPIWLWHGHEHNTQIRVGMWYAGEHYFWGEQVAIAGRILSNYVLSDKPADVIVYSNYGHVWPGNPGYNIIEMVKGDGFQFDENSFYVLSKFRLFREEPPAFISEVSPLFTLSYKEEIGAWVYRGDQLIEYANWFKN